MGTVSIDHQPRPGLRLLDLPKRSLFGDVWGRSSFRIAFSKRASEEARFAQTPFPQFLIAHEWRPDIAKAISATATAFFAS
jgi:hypothetical protein